MPTPDPERTALAVFYEHFAICSACGDGVDLSRPIHDMALGEPIDCGVRFIGATLGPGGSMYDLKQWGLPYVSLDSINYGGPINFAPANTPSVGLLDSHDY